MAGTAIGARDGPFDGRGAGSPLPRLWHVLFILIALFLLFKLDANQSSLVGDLCLIVIAALLLGTASTGWYLCYRGRE